MIRNETLNVLVSYANKLGLRGKVYEDGSGFYITLNGGRDYSIIAAYTWGYNRSARYVETCLFPYANSVHSCVTGYSRNLESVKRSLRYYAAMQRNA